MDRITALRAYVRVVETGSFSAAARELRVKQPTVSKWIAALEAELGTQLIERTTRSQRVTEPGERFLGHARQILAAHDEAMADMLERLPEPRGRIRMSVPVVFGRRHLLGPLERFLARHPRIELELVFGDRYVRLVDEGLDVAVRVGTPVDSSDRAIRLGGTGRKVVASPAYLEAHGAPRRPSDLRDHACLTHTGLSASWWFSRRGKTRRVRVGGRVAANHSDALLAMALASHGVAMLADWLVDEPIEQGRLVHLLEGWALPEAPISALVPPTRHVQPHVRALLDHLSAELRPRFA